MDRFLKIKKQFPLFGNHAKPLVYLDNAATTQKPKVILDALERFYTRANSNVNRGIYGLSELATEEYERARVKAAQFVNARGAKEIVFTKSATEAINLVAYTWGEKHVSAGDEIVVSIAEHHSNFLPWQQLAARKRAVLKIIPFTSDWRITRDDTARQFSAKTKIVAIHHVSNVLGTVAPLDDVIAIARKFGAKVLVDAAQSIAHMPVDVRALDCDWLAFSGHKMYGPTGIGVLYGKEELLADAPPFIFGGGMIKEVRIESAEWADLPQKFEGGTPPIAEAIALGAAIEFLGQLTFKVIQKHEEDLLEYALARLSGFKGIMVYGPQGRMRRNGIVSFNLGAIHSHDIATLVDERGIALRSGHHCAQPLMRVLGTPTACRVSFAVYNSREDIDRLMDALEYAKTVLA